MVKSLYFICWFTVRKSKCYFTFWSRSIIKGYFPRLFSQPAVPSRSCFGLPECFANLSTYGVILRSRQIKYKAHQDVPAPMYFSMRRAQRLEGLWSYCLKMTFQKLICKSSSETSFTRQQQQQALQGDPQALSTCFGAWLRPRTHWLCCSSFSYFILYLGLHPLAVSLHLLS